MYVVLHNIHQICNHVDVMPQKNTRFPDQLRKQILGTSKLHMSTDYFPRVGQKADTLSEGSPGMLVLGARRLMRVGYLASQSQRIGQWSQVSVWVDSWAILDSPIGLCQQHTHCVPIGNHFYNNYHRWDEKTSPISGRSPLL
jgi:hypothetical protein